MRPGAPHLAAACAATALLVVLATSTDARRAPVREAQYVDARTLRLRYVRAGRPRGQPTLVLLHGYGESMMAWRGVFDRLARQREVLAIDLPGFGLSTKPATGYATDSLAADVSRALDALHVRRTVIVGHSLGGAVAAALALRDTARVSALVLLDAALVGTPAPVNEARQEDGARGTTGTAIAAYEALRTRFAVPHDAHWLRESDSAGAYLPADDPAYAVALAAVLREFDFAWLTPDRAARLRLPALVLWGEFDEIFPLSAGAALARDLPNARFQVIARSLHRPHLERPDETADAILAFLESLPRR
jgi:pimeloyl-ACP methyl ester carboxylesterase